MTHLDTGVSLDGACAGLGNCAAVTVCLLFYDAVRSRHLLQTRWHISHHLLPPSLAKILRVFHSKTGSHMEGIYFPSQIPPKCTQIGDLTLNWIHHL